MKKAEPLNQDLPIGDTAVNGTAKVQINLETGRSILDAMKDFVNSVPDFLRLDKGNIRPQPWRHRHSYNTGANVKMRRQGDIIEFGKHNLKKLQSSMGTRYTNLTLRLVRELCLYFHFK